MTIHSLGGEGSQKFITRLITMMSQPIVLRLFCSVIVVVVVSGGGVVVVVLNVDVVV